MGKKGGNNQKPFKKKGAQKRGRETDDLDKIEVVQGNNTTPAVASHKKRKKKQAQIGIAAENSDKCTVVVRQRVNHKRTFYYLEQMIIKHDLRKHQCSSMDIREVSNGFDATFEKAYEATKFVDFLNAVLPIDMKEQKQNMSMNMMNKDNYKPHYTVEIAPICKDDVCCFPQRMYNSMGNLGPLVICYKVTNGMFFIDPITLKMGEVPAQHFFQKEKSFKPIFTRNQLVEYTVLQVEMSDKKTKSGKFHLGEVQVVKTCDMGDPNATCFAKCHFAHQLSAGDLVMGYDMKHANLNDEVLTSYKSLQLPDAILIKKKYERARKRYWKLKSTNMMTIDDDYDEFMDDLEDDQEMRENVLVFKNSNYTLSKEEEEKIKQDKKTPRISLEELLDELSL